MARILTRSLRYATLVVLFSGCGRSDPFAFDRFDEHAGESGTNTGGRSSGGSDVGGTRGFSGTSGASTGGFAGKGGVCPAGLTFCDGSCVDLRSDEVHCGSCYSFCSPDAVCFDGSCSSPCPGGTLCFASCTDLSSDVFNCGACGNYCPTGFVCSYGYCQNVCGPEGFVCGDTCVDPFNDPLNCGGCGNQCGVRQFCSAGICSELPDSQAYSVSASPLSFVNACVQPGALTVLRGLDDDTYSPIRIPWFGFYGAPAEFAWVSTNGVLGFGNPTIAFGNECFFGAIDRAVLAFWDDLMTGTGGICLAEIGTAPNRQYVATWNQTGILERLGETSLTFSIVLSESTQTIDVLYGSMTGGGLLSAGASATIGLAGVGQISLDCCNQACVRSNTGRRYTPTFR